MQHELGQEAVVPLFPDSEGEETGDGTGASTQASLAAPIALTETLVTTMSNIGGGARPSHGAPKAPANPNPNPGNTKKSKDHKAPNSRLDKNDAPGGVEPKTENKIRIIGGSTWSSGSTSEAKDPDVSEADLAKLALYRSCDWSVTQKFVNYNTNKIMSTTANDSIYEMVLKEPRKGVQPHLVIGRSKSSAVGEGRDEKVMYFSDVSILADEGRTTITQMKCKHVVVCGLSQSQFNKATAASRGRSSGHNRFMGNEFARIGLPLAHFLPVITTALSACANADSVTMTPHYAYMQASWGTRGQPCHVTYSVGDKTDRQLDNQMDLHRMLKGKSAIGIATIGIAISAALEVYAEEEEMAALGIDDAETFSGPGTAPMSIEIGHGYDQDFGDESDDGHRLL
eukprot:gene24321-9927_t